MIENEIYFAERSDEERRNVIAARKIGCCTIAGAFISGQTSCCTVESRAFVFDIRILSQCPRLVPKPLPRRWEQCTRAAKVSSEWSRSELIDTFTELSRHSDMSERFCIFIDGLVEYDGDHGNIIDLIKNFVQSKDVEICMSSCPWNVFEVELGRDSCPTSCPKNLARDDIKHHMRKELEKIHPFS